MDRNTKMSTIAQHYARFVREATIPDTVFEEMRWHKMGGANLRHLSMGMSHDFEMAIAEGATMVRIGSLLFGGKSFDHEEAVESGI